MCYVYLHASASYCDYFFFFDFCVSACFAQHAHVLPSRNVHMQIERLKIISSYTNGPTAVLILRRCSRGTFRVEVSVSYSIIYKCTILCAPCTRTVPAAFNRHANAARTTTLTRFLLRHESESLLLNSCHN